MGECPLVTTEQIVKYSVLFLGTFIDDKIIVKYEIDSENNTTIVIDFIDELNYTSFKLQYTDIAFITCISELVINEFRDDST